MVECSADRRQPGLQLTQSHQSGSAINAGTTVVSHTKNRVGDYRQFQKPKMVSAMSRNEIKCLLVRNKTQSIALNYTDFNLPSGFSAALSPLQGVSGKRMTAPRDENKENHPKNVSEYLPREHKSKNARHGSTEASEPVSQSPKYKCRRWIRAGYCIHPAAPQTYPHQGKPN